MRKIVIAPYQMHRNLLRKFREKDPFLDVKMMSKEELVNEYYGRVDDKAIPYLMRKYDLSYDNAITLMSFIPFINKSINLCWYFSIGFTSYPPCQNIYV